MSVTTHDDSYKISLFELFFHNRPNTTTEIEYLLDNNGYSRRHKEWQVQEFGKLTNKIKIEIYLPYSDFKYQWPINNWYNLETHRLHNKHKKYKGAAKEFTWMDYVLYHLHDENVITVPDMNQKIFYMVNCCSIREIPCRKAFMNVLKAGLLTSEYKCCIQKKDIQEVYDNLFNEEKIEFLT
ncbi:MAG TPA: hypothetical protein VHB70_14395 [Parafilimonas sp.]|nr:hypothetical protein [Parafilimonas sp.]